jgi:hypothetical protein
MWPRHLSEIQRQLRLENWDAATPSGGALLVWNLSLHGDEFPGWTIAHIDRIVHPEGYRLISAIFSKEGDEAAVRLQIASYRSRARARRALLERMVAVHLPMLDRLADALGEISFGTPNGSSLMFLRGNIVVEAAQLGSQDAGVLELARLVDDLLTAMPSQSTGAVAAHTARIAVFASEQPASISARQNQPVWLTGLAGQNVSPFLSRTVALEAATGEPPPAVPMPDLELEGPSESRSPLLKLVAGSGELVVDEQGFHYVPAARGEQIVTMVSEGRKDQPVERTSWRVQVDE